MRKPKVLKRNRNQRTTKIWNRKKQNPNRKSLKPKPKPKNQINPIKFGTGNNRTEKQKF